MSGAFYPPDGIGTASGWRLLVTDGVLGAFDPGTPVSVMSAVWRTAADPESGLEGVVGSVPLKGPDAVGSFVLAALGRSIVFVVAGEGCADVSAGGRVRRIDARGAEPFFVAEVTDARAFALGPLERSPGDLMPREQDRPIDGGVVYGAWLGWTASMRPVTGPQQSAFAAAAERSGVQLPVSGPALLSAGSGPTPVPPSDGSASRPSHQPSAPASYPPFVPPPVAPAAQQNAAGDTNVFMDLGRRTSTLDRRGEPPATAPSPENAASACFRIGERSPERVDAPVYVGRQPRSPRVTGPTLPKLVRVESPSREVSATHVELRPTAEGIVLTDLRSTNGTVVRQPGSGVRRLESGESLAVLPGTLVDIGDGNVIEILPWR